MAYLLLGQHAVLCLVALKVAQLEHDVRVSNSLGRHGLAIRRRFLTESVKGGVGAAQR